MRTAERFLAGLVSATFWTGFFPWGPGTVGSLVALFFFVLCPVHLRLPLLFPLILAAWAGCVLGRKLWGEDPSRVTVDEVAGCWLACLFSFPGWGFRGLAAAFILFRIFDIAKPWPVSVLDRMKSGSGILLDDLAAGLMAGAVLLIAGLFVQGG